MKSYHFDLGNSSTGPIGFRARIEAESPEQAVELLKAALSPEEEPLGDQYSTGVDYIRVYVNSEAITTANIDSIDEIGEEEE